MSLNILVRLKYLIFTLFFCVLFLNACGKLGESLGAASPQALQVKFQLPAGIDPEFFWGDITQKIFLWKAESSDREQHFSLEEAAKLDWKFDEPGLLRFEGRDRVGNLLVRGQTFVRDEKQILLPLQRVL